MGLRLLCASSCLIKSRSGCEEPNSGSRLCCLLRCDCSFHLCFNLSKTFNKWVKEALHAAALSTSSSGDSVCLVAGDSCQGGWGICCQKSISPRATPFSWPTEVHDSRESITGMEQPGLRHISRSVSMPTPGTGGPHGMVCASSAMSEPVLHF